MCRSTTAVSSKQDLSPEKHVRCSIYFQGMAQALKHFIQLRTLIILLFFNSVTKQIKKTFRQFFDDHDYGESILHKKTMYEIYLLI